MAVADDIAEIKERQIKIEVMLKAMNGKSIWDAINKLRIGMAIVYAVPVITMGVWLVAKALKALGNF